MALKGVDTPKVDPTREGEAFLRIANAITANLPAITTSHWRLAAEDFQRSLAAAADRRARPGLQRIDGGRADGRR